MRPYPEGANFLLHFFLTHHSKALFSQGLFRVRPTWAHSCGCKSRRELTTVSEVKRNYGRVTNRGKEAWIVNHEPMDKNCIEGGADQGERARHRKALVVKDPAA
jgi:hypothetical protein